MACVATDFLADAARGASRCATVLGINRFEVAATSPLPVAGVRVLPSPLRCLDSTTAEVRPPTVIRSLPNLGIQFLLYEVLKTALGYNKPALVESR